MSLWPHLAAGLLLAVAGWCGLRRMVRAKSASLAGLAADGALPLIGFALLLAATGKPLFAGSAVFVTIVGLALADRRKRRRFLEPVVFADGYQTLDVLVRHPELNMLFSRRRNVACLASAVLGLLSGMFVSEAGLWPLGIGTITSAIAAAAAVRAISGPLLGRCAGFFCGAEPPRIPCAMRQSSARWRSISLIR